MVCVGSAEGELRVPGLQVREPGRELWLGREESSHDGRIFLSWRRLVF